MSTLKAALFTLAGAAVLAAAGAGGYALNAASAPAPGTGGSAPEPSEAIEPGEVADPGPGPFGNGAGLTYTRLSGTTFLLVLGGDGVASLTPEAAEAVGDGVAFEFTAQYFASDGELAVRSRDFFHYAHPGDTEPQGSGEEAVTYPAEDEELAVLSPGDPVQEFTVVLPGAPEEGAISYDPADITESGLTYRTPLCYQVSGDFSPRREECEPVPEPSG